MQIRKFVVLLHPNSSNIMKFLIAIDNWIESLPFKRNKRLKGELRAVLTQKRKMLQPEYVSAGSADVVQQILALPAFQQAQTVLIYYPIYNEIDLRELFTLAPDKKYLLPVTHRKSIEVRPYEGADKMKKGKFGIPEPQTETYKGKIDLIFVPGVAFDKAGNRMGRGGGYYDRFLRNFRHTTKIGVAYDFQITKTIPTTWNDIKLDKVITSRV